MEKTAEANGGLTKKDYTAMNSPLAHNLIESYHLNIGAYLFQTFFIPYILFYPTFILFFYTFSSYFTPFLSYLSNFIQFYPILSYFYQEIANAVSSKDTIP